MTILLILLGLSVALTLSGSIALVIRRTKIGRTDAMGLLWAVVLVLAVLPLNFPLDLPSPVPSTVEAPRLTTPETPTVEQTPLTPERVDLAPEQPATVLTREDAPVRWGAPLLLTVWAIGATVMLLRPLRQSRRLGAMLRACSSPCTDTVLRLELTHLCDKLGLRKTPELRILDDSLPLPPCTTGFFAPHIYLPADLPTDPDAMAAILAHELCHIRRRDIWHKLIALAALSLHWFNPLAHLLLPRMYEDLEPACDRATLRLLGGEDARIPYMRTLIDMAGAIRTPAPSAALFFVGNGHTKKTLERRFIAMKKTRHPTLTRLVTLTLVLTLTLLSSLAFTACAELTGLEIHAADGSLFGAGYAELSPLAERIIRYYYDLTPTDEITAEMREGVTSLKLSVADIDANLDELRDLLARAKEPHIPDLTADGVDRSPRGLSEEQIEDIEQLLALLGEKTLVSFEINTRDAAPGSKEALYAGRECFAILPRNFYESTVISPIRSSGDEQADWCATKVDAYYTRKDADECQDERARAELISTFPGIEEQASYLQDPTMSIADRAVVYALLADYGILEPQLLDATVIDTAALYAAFPNLDTIELVGLTEK